ncbi:enoyl-CoA hydratase/isomerase family protein [Antrihabitans sp. YC2-6]|uniref:enoyl-CoA hydratase/isomerase family protein n=1 Tax=Antrihabitans sp. YC2-6 TaxID=2799498 RepID=UPI0018F651E8|nr:enoyl-CoA hydratase/isomerase family protein [Antrihabitans sp. YC2-6]MBJ8348114.1 enoyl-CoA hydratase/isomerase family protein [Antrihabitans sp. YC2-6]
MTDDVLIEKRDGLGLITLNRPKAINALNHAMVHPITAALWAWAEDEDVTAVVITGSGERGLCAGGDIVSIYYDAQKGGADSSDFWRDEYVLNALIARFPKPYVAVMDGIVMGGGVGISAHGSHRIVTERSKIGMPEVGIGFVPDVGGTYLLAQAPGELGTHVALTTARMSAADAIATGFADHFVPTSDLPALLAALASGPVSEVVAKFAQEPPLSELVGQQDWIDECYSADTVEQIVARLRAHSSPEANKAAEAILSKSPIAVKVALLSLRRARDASSIEEVLNDEYRVSLACLKSRDLVEGIRAQVIDKDRNPAWSPATLEAVTDDQVAAYFADLGELELGLAAPDSSVEGQQ